MVLIDSRGFILKTCLNSSKQDKEKSSWPVGGCMYSE